MKKNRIKSAIALKYDIDKDNAPKVVAAGKGYFAQKIIDEAKQNDIYIKKDDKLAEKLIKIDILSEIPPELYDVVAELIYLAYHLDKNWQEKLDKK